MKTIGLIAIVMVILVLGGLDSNKSDFTWISGGVVVTGIVVAIVCFALPDFLKKTKEDGRRDDGPGLPQNVGTKSR